MAVTTTQSGTVIVEGVEYGTYPPPPVLVKAMERRWAEELLAVGAMRFGSLALYREWENTILGDPNDGKGMFRMEGNQYNIGSVNPVYAWCASLPTVSADRTLLLAENGRYDCVVRVSDPLLLIHRVRSASVRTSKTLHVHCAQVSYNRGAEVDKWTLNSQKFHFNVFQKSSAFAPDLEYRLSLTDVSLCPESKPDVCLRVGDCSDIMVIENLPDKLHAAAARTLPR